MASFGKAEWALSPYRWQAGVMIHQGPEKGLCPQLWTGQIFFIYENLAVCFFLLQEIASEFGCHQLLWLFGEDRKITEVGAMNVFIFYKNEIGGNITIRLLHIKNHINECNL